MNPLRFILALLLVLPTMGQAIMFGRNSAFSRPAPLTLSVSALQYLRADSLAAGAVSSWTDESGNGKDATQATGANQPTAVANQYNGHACVRFASDDFMTYSDVTSSAYWVVFKATTYDAALSAFCGDNAFDGVDCFFADLPYENKGPGGFDGANLRTANLSNKIATGAIHSLLVTPTQIFVDGVEVSGYADIGTLSNVLTQRINGRDVRNFFVFAFDLIESAHYGSAPSVSDRSALVSWAQSQYGAP